MATQKKRIGIFEKYLTLWVALGIAAGIAIGHFGGEGIEVLSKMEVFRVNIPVAVLIWLMIYPMMLQVDFSSIKNIKKRPKGIVLMEHSYRAFSSSWSYPWLRE